MTGTNLQTIILFSIFIAIICLFLKPKFIMIFVLLFIYLLPRAGFMLKTTWYHFPLPIGYVIIAFLMVRWIFYLLFGGGKVEKKNPIRKIFLIYVIIAILAIAVGFINGGNTPIIVLETLFYFAAFFTFFMAIDIFETKDCARIFMTGILLCGFLVSLYGILLLIYGKSILINYVTYNASSYIALEGQFISAKRTLSTYGDPNVLNAQLMVFCGIFASLYLKGRYGFFKRTLLFIALILTIICIYFASSRASLIGLFVLLIAFAATRIKKLWLYIPVLLAGYFMFIEPVRKYYEHRIFTAGITQDLRITYIWLFFELLIRFPLGVGFGNTINENFMIIPAANVWYGFNSFYLHFLSRVGIQGLLVFLIMLFLILRYLFKGSDRIADPNIRYFIFGAMWGIIVQQLNFVTNNVYQVPGGMLNFWIMCGMLTVIVNLYAPKRDT